MMLISAMNVPRKELPRVVNFSVRQPKDYHLNV